MAARKDLDHFGSTLTLGIGDERRTRAVRRGLVSGIFEVPSNNIDTNQKLARALEIVLRVDPNLPALDPQVLIHPGDPGLELLEATATSFGKDKANIRLVYREPSGSISVDDPPGTKAIFDTATERVQTFRTTQHHSLFADPNDPQIDTFGLPSGRYRDDNGASESSINVPRRPHRQDQQPRTEKNWERRLTTMTIITALGNNPYPGNFLIQNHINDTALVLGISYFIGFDGFFPAYSVRFDGCRVVGVPTAAADFPGGVRFDVRYMFSIANKGFYEQTCVFDYTGTGGNPPTPGPGIRGFKTAPVLTHPVATFTTSAFPVV